MRLRKFRQVSVGRLLWCLRPTGKPRRIMVISYERKLNADRLQPLQYILRLVDGEFGLRKLNQHTHKPQLRYRTCDQFIP